MIRFAWDFWTNAVPQAYEAMSEGWHRDFMLALMWPAAVALFALGMWFVAFPWVCGARLAGGEPYEWES